MCFRYWTDESLKIRETVEERFYELFFHSRHPCRRIGMRTIEECDIISPEAESRPKKSDLIIVLSKKRNRQNKSAKRPYYGGRRRVWKVE